MDAFEKLLKLGLNTKQEREIITVAVECCANETVYNAYYTHLLNKFISYHRRFLVGDTVFDGNCFMICFHF